MSSLYSAISNNCIDIVKKLLKHPKIDVNIFYKYTKTEKCITRKISITTTDKMTPLHLAITNKNINIAKLLLSMPNIDVNLISKSTTSNNISTNVENNALCLAVENNCIEIVKLLLADKNININNKYIDQRTFCGPRKDDIKERNALLLAVEKKHADIVQLLVEHTKYEINNICIFQTREGTYYDSIKSTKKDYSVLLLAIENEDAKIAEIILSNPYVDINIKYKSESTNEEANGDYHYFYTYEKTALILAIEKKNVQIVNLLLTRKNIEINDPYICITKYGYTIEKSPLFIAVEINDCSLVKALLTNKNIDVNMFSREYSNGNNPVNKFYTPLHYAVKYKLTAITGVLVKHEKIDVNIKNSDGITPIDLMNETQMLKILSNDEDCE